MTKKDFELIASVIETERNNTILGSKERATVQSLARRMASRLRQTNYRFDTDRFLNACGC